MAQDARYLILYDLSDDRERERTATVLEGMAVRVQKSAFEGRLTRALRDRLRRRLAELRLESGWVGLYRLDGQGRRWTAGTVPDSALAEERHCFAL